MKRAEEENDFVFKFRYERCFRQRVALSIFSQYEKEKNFGQIIEMGRELLKKQKHYVDHKELYAVGAFRER